MRGYTFNIHVFGLATGLQHLDLCGHHDPCHHPTMVSPMIPPLPSAASHDIYLESLEMNFNDDALVGYLSRPDRPLKISRLRELRTQSIHTATATMMKSVSQSLEPLIWTLLETFGAHESSGEDWFGSLCLNLQGSTHRLAYKISCLSVTSLCLCHIQTIQGEP